MRGLRGGRRGLWAFLEVNRWSLIASFDFLSSGSVAVVTFPIIAARFIGQFLTPGEVIFQDLVGRPATARFHELLDAICDCERYNRH